MPIPARTYPQIAAIDIDAHKTEIAYPYWEGDFPPGTFLRGHIDTIKRELSSPWSRSDLVSFYKKHDIALETKFIAAMMWGHEAPAGSRRDSRGPWKLSMMFSDPAATVAAIKAVSIKDDADIAKSYRRLNKELNRCGPNFFTKHFYFLGKAANESTYPLIFDDRVATGLVKIGFSTLSALNAVRVAADRTPDAYLAYLQLARTHAARIGCALDKIEYFLFTEANVRRFKGDALLDIGVTGAQECNGP